VGGGWGAPAAGGVGARDARADFPAPPSIPAVLLTPQSSGAAAFDAPYTTGRQGGAAPR